MQIPSIVTVAHEALDATFLAVRGLLAAWTTQTLGANMERSVVHHSNPGNDDKLGLLSIMRWADGRAGGWKDAMHKKYFVRISSPRNKRSGDCPVSYTHLTLPTKA